MERRRGRTAGVAAAGGILAIALAMIIGATLVEQPASVGAARPSVSDDDIAVASAATLRIVARGCDAQVTGSAFAVRVPELSQLALVTNKHIVTDAPEAKLDAPVRAQVTPVLASSDTVDVAALRPIGSIALALSPNVPERGDPIVVIGHPAGGPVELIETEVHLVSDGAAWGQDARVVLFDAAVIPGYSGGPLIGADGTVVGVVTGYAEATGLGVAVLGADLLLWLEQNLPESPEIPVQEPAKCDD